MVWKAKTELQYLLVRGLPSMVEHFLAVAFPGRRLVASRVDKGGAVTCVVEAHGGLAQRRAGQERPAAAAMAAHPGMATALCADEVARTRLAEQGSARPQAFAHAALEVRWVRAPGRELESMPLV